MWRDGEGSRDRLGEEGHWAHEDEALPEGQLKGRWAVTQRGGLWAVVPLTPQPDRACRGEGPCFIDHTGF